MKNAHRSIRFESLSKAESSVTRPVLVIPHSNGGEDGIYFPLIEQDALSIKSSLDPNGTLSSAD